MTVSTTGSVGTFTSATSASSSTFAHDATGADVLVVMATYQDGGVGRTISGITYNGVALTKIAAAGPLFAMRAEMWYLVGPASGSNNIVISYTGACVNHAHAGVNLVGVDTASPIGTQSSTTSTAHSVSRTVTSATDELVLDVVRYFSSESSPDVSQTQLYENNISSYRGAGSTKPGASSVTMTWTRDTGGNCDWAIVACPFHAGVTDPYPASYRPTMREHRIPHVRM